MDTSCAEKYKNNKIKKKNFQNREKKFQNGLKNRKKSFGESKGLIELREKFWRAKIYGTGYFFFCTGRMNFCEKRGRRYLGLGTLFS